MSQLIYDGLVFNTTNPNVYPPKPASLLLAEWAIIIVRPRQAVLDVCTGSGVVGIAVAKFVSESTVIISDIEPHVLTVAQANARKNNVIVEAVQSDLYSAFAESSFDIITVHPPAVPYIPNQTWGMSKGMTIATNGGVDGSELVIRSIAEARRCLRSHGKLLLLLPHWSNTTKAFSALEKNYSSVKVLAKKQIQFFPVLEGKPEPEVVAHALMLARKGIIELEELDGHFFLMLLSYWPRSNSYHHIVYILSQMR